MSFINNPYRILGILAGTSKREQDRSVRRLRQYIEADQVPEDDYSFPILGNVIRNQQTVDDAMSHINLDKDKLSAALFWFYNGNPITDEPAFDSLKEGDINTAEEIWNKLVSSGEVTVKNYSAYHDLSTLYLHIATTQPERGELIKDAIRLELKFLESDFIKDFKAKITDETFKTSKKDIQLEYLSTVSNVIVKTKVLSRHELIDLLKNETFQAKDTFFKKVADELISEIDKAVMSTRNKRVADKNESIKTANTLYKKTSPDLILLRDLLGSGSLQYASTCDSVAIELLQCGIDYFNEHRDSDYIDPAESVKVIFNKAKKIVVGNIADQRIDENIEGLRDWIANKPEREKQKLVKVDLERIISLFQTFETKQATIENATSLINSSKPLLANIKKTLGATDKLYLNLSTQIAAQAQSYIIDDVNNAQEKLSANTEMERVLSLVKLKSVLSNAWTATILLGTLDTTSDFRINRYNVCKESLKGLCRQVGVSTSTQSTSPHPTRPNATAAKPMPPGIPSPPRPSIPAPSPKPQKESNTGCIVMLVIGVIIGAIFLFNNLNADKKAFNRISIYSAKPYEYERFIEDYPNSAYVDKAYDGLFTIAERGGLSSLNEFANKYSHISQGRRAKEKVAEQCKQLYNIAQATNSIEGWESYKRDVPYSEYRDADTRINAINDQLYNIALATNTIKAWESYKTKVPTSQCRDANERIKAIEEKVKWGTDSKAWAQATSLNTLTGYNKYLNLYPNGSRRKQAEKKVIDIQVANVFSGSYGQLPSMDKVGWSQGQSSTISIKNSTAYTLTLLYSGNDSKRVVISPNASSRVTLPNGRYRIAASVNASNVRSFAGTEDLSGGQYEVQYYIQTSRF